MYADRTDIIGGAIKRFFQQIAGNQHHDFSTVNWANIRAVFQRKTSHAHRNQAAPGSRTSLNIPSQQAFANSNNIAKSTNELGICICS